MEMSRKCQPPNALRDSAAFRQSVDSASVDALPMLLAIITSPKHTDSPWAIAPSVYMATMEISL
jgi:hypothetical protein